MTRHFTTRGETVKVLQGKLEAGGERVCEDRGGKKQTSALRNMERRHRNSAIVHSTKGTRRAWRKNGLWETT